MFHDPNYKDSPSYEEPEGLDDDTLMLLALDSIIPAVCIHGCEVEPDGACPHGMPSLLIHLEIL